MGHVVDELGGLGDGGVPTEDEVELGRTRGSSGQRRVPDGIDGQMGQPLAEKLGLLAARGGQCPECVCLAMSGDVEVSGGHGA